MSKIFAHATKQNPCTVCGKTDWCTFGDKAQLCQRIESSRPHAKGGWWHFYDEKKSNLQVTIPKSRPAPAPLDAEAKMETCQGIEIDYWANELGVSRDSLEALGAGYNTQHKALAFPMSDGDGKYIGIRLRNQAGDKWAVLGSRQGVFVPNCEPKQVAYLPEGPTDTAALLTMGLFAIGRPSCTGGNEIIAQTLKRLKIHRVVIVADNDELKQLGQRQGRPGIEGAIKLKKELGLSSVIWFPPAPIKDARAFLKAGGTRQVIESEIKNKVWSKK